jgi:hypothetical protein
MHGINNKYVVVPILFPVDNAGVVVSDVINLKNYNQAEIYLMTAAAMTKTSALTLHQGVSVGSCATALPFTKYYQTGCKLKYDGASSNVGAAAGETATGASTAVGTVVEDRGGILILADWNSTAFVDNEVLTFSGGKTAVVDGIRYDEDIMVPTDAVANTFNITQVLDVNKLYCIPVNGAMLDQGMTCIELNLADCDSPTILAAWVILSEPRFAGNPSPTAIY